MKPVQGHLEIMDQGFGFLRSIEHNFKPSPDNPFVPAGMIKKLGLREGSFIQGMGDQKSSKQKNLALSRIEHINRLPAETFLGTPLLQDQVSINPFERYRFAQSPEDTTGKALDLISPIGKGQRGLVISPPKSGKTTVLKHMAESIGANHPDSTVFMLLVDERPEEVTDFQRGLSHTHVLYSSADQNIDQHMRMTRLSLHTAIRCAEAGQDAVVFIDSLTRMTRAFNVKTDSGGRTMTGGLGANAMEFPRKIFGAARKLEKGGSLTIVATILVDTGSRMDDIIYQEFKGTANMDLVLSRECAEKRIWPAVDVQQSGTRKEALLLDKEEYELAGRIRSSLPTTDKAAAMNQFLDMLP